MSAYVIRIPTATGGDFVKDGEGRAWLYRTRVAAAIEMMDTMIDAMQTIMDELKAGAIDEDEVDEIDPGVYDYMEAVDAYERDGKWFACCDDGTEVEAVWDK